MHTKPQPTRRPNILFILTDDHAAHAMSAYGSRLNQTPHLDRIATGGMRCDACYCTNSICTPSRASILTGQHTHVCGVRTLDETLDNQHDPQLQRILRSEGYRTAIFGKWHLGFGPQPDGTNADPNGFDEWAVFPGQGSYYDPVFHTGTSDGRTSCRTGELQSQGYATDLITDMSLDWLDRWEQTADEDEPFLLCVHHKAPHRHWEPGPQEQHLYENDSFIEPETLWDDYADRPAAAIAKMRISHDLNHQDVKATPPAGVSDEDRTRWYYNQYLKEYLRCVAGVDRNVGRLLDALDDKGLTEDTIVVYTSDQGFFLGEHGWFDKRFMYEESLRMPLLIRYPQAIAAGGSTDAMLTNVDFAPTLLDLAGIAIPEAMQGRSAREVLAIGQPDDWQRSVYYRYWMHGDPAHHTTSHYGVRTRTHKLIYYYADALDTTIDGAVRLDIEPYWELYDLTADPGEVHNIYNHPGNEEIKIQLKQELNRLQAIFKDQPKHCTPNHEATEMGIH